MMNQCKEFFKKFTFTGYLRSNEDLNIWVDVYNKAPLPNFTWNPGQPNNYNGIENCSVLEPVKELLWDDKCSRVSPSICEVKLYTVFQLDGVCESIHNLDTFYVVSKEF